MKKMVILNFPYKSTDYDDNEIDNYERWIDFFCRKTSGVIVTPPIERKNINFSKNINNIKNLKIFPVTSFDTCDRWKAGLSNAINNSEIDIFCFWSADFEFNPLSKNSADLLINRDDNYDLVVGTIEATGRKELIDQIATLPLTKNWFPEETQIIERKGFSKPRSELFKISKLFASFLLSNRWYPSEQTIYILLQSIWNCKRFTMNQISLGKIQDDEEDRYNKNVIQQIERMELWLKYMWRDHNNNWQPDQYLSKSEKSSSIVRKANKFIMDIDNPFKYSVTDETYRFIIDNSWKDIHHSRNQDWTALGVIFGAHIGVFQLIDYFKDKISLASTNIYYVLGGLFGIFLSCLGLMMARRHKSLMKIKMKWICEAEDRIGLLKNENSPDGVVYPEKYNGISTNSLIILIYVLFIIVNVTIITIFYN